MRDKGERITKELPSFWLGSRLLLLQEKDVSAELGGPVTRGPTGIKDRYKENCISRPKSTFPLGDDPKCVLVTWQIKKKKRCFR